MPDLTNLYFDGQKVDPKNVCFVGTRDLDPKEKLLMSTIRLPVALRIKSITEIGLKKPMTGLYRCALAHHILTIITRDDKKCVM